MKIISTRTDKTTGIKMATVSLVIPLEVADLVPAVAKLEGHDDPDYLAFYAIKNYMGAYDYPTCDDQPTDEEKRAYGFTVEAAAKAG